MIHRLKMAGLWFASDVWRAARTAVFFVQIALVGFTDSKPNFEFIPNIHIYPRSSDGSVGGNREGDPIGKHLDASDDRTQHPSPSNRVASPRNPQ